jgi:hypothetical protein
MHLNVSLWTDRDLSALLVGVSCAALPGICPRT